MSRHDSPSVTKERVHLSKELICKSISAEWVFDTGAISPMTDQLHLFRGPLHKTRRDTIQVGGGELHSDQRGTALLLCKDVLRFHSKRCRKYRSEEHTSELQSR